MKRVKVAEKRNLRNREQRSKLRTVLRRSREAIENKAENAKEAFDRAIKAIDMAVSKRILHRNTAARKKSTLAKKFNSVFAEK